MANYDRRILVPYLQDVCCAEMVCEKLEQDVQKARAESDKLTQWANGDYRDPEKPTPRSCRETDLDKIIQTMLLDEIVKRMDVLIAQNQTILINQRMQIAMQERQNRMIAENQRQQMRQIAQFERNQQLQLDYQEMIARNQEMTNFFLAADYLRRYK